MKRIFGTILFFGMAVSANAADYYLTDGGTSSGGTLTTTTGTVTPTIADTLYLADGSATHTVNGTGSTYNFNVIFSGRSAGTDHTLTINGGTWNNAGGLNSMLDMGGYGTGRVILQGEANMTIRNGVLVGVYDGSRGELTVTGTGTVLTVNGGNGVHIGGSSIIGGDYRTSGTMTISNNAALHVNSKNGLNIGYGANGIGTANITTGGSVTVTGADLNVHSNGTLNVEGGTINTTDLTGDRHIRVYGTMNVAGIQNSTGVVTTPATVTVDYQLHVGGGTDPTQLGIVSVNEGGSFTGGTTFVHQYGTLNINTATPGSTFARINLQENGTLVINAPYTVASGVLYLTEWQGKTLGTNGNLAVNHAGATVYLNTGAIHLLSNKGILYCNDAVISPTVHFARTDTVYGGEMDAYQWIAGHVNIGTAQAPVRMNPDPISAVGNDRRENYRFSYLGIGENGATGYAEFEGGIMRIAQVDDEMTKGLIIGDDNPASNGTLVLKTGGGDSWESECRVNHPTGCDGGKIRGYRTPHPGEWHFAGQSGAGLDWREWDVGSWKWNLHLE
ncbi:MAG: hypothetical protein Q4D62_10625 [Planctomycetia bacterium]|nr:hypothetical protein [Planctomycetia bacterium]